MKNLFLLLLFTCSVSALANTAEAETKTVNKIENLALINEGDFETDDTKKKNKGVQITPDGSRFGLSYYLVDFINRNNLKIVKCFLKD